MKKKIILASLLTLTTVGTIMGIACGSKVNADGVTTAVNSLVTKYRHNGNYTKETEVYLTDLAVNELSMHGGFHQSSKLKRTTYYTPDALWMSQDEEGSGVKYSYYGTEGENLTYGVADTALVKPNVSIAATKTHKDWHNDKEDGMEGFYVTLKDIVVTDDQVWTVSNGVYSTENVDVINWFKAFCAPCYLGFTAETGNYIDLTSASIEEVDDTLVLSLYAANATETVLSGEEGVFATAVVSQRHTYSETTGLCECGKDQLLSLIASHSGNSAWDFTSNGALNASGILVQNISKAPNDGNGNLTNFTENLRYEYYDDSGTWGRYLIHLVASNNTLTIQPQLGINPYTWGEKATLKEEHIARLISDDGLDLVFYFNDPNNTLACYISTNHKLEKVFEVNCESKINNFYKTSYSSSTTLLSNNTTTVYKTYDTSVETIYEELGLVLTDHSYVEVAATEASCDTDGIAAHKECIICGNKVGIDGNEVDVIPMTGHTYVEGTCSVCSKTNPLTIHASQTWTGQSTWDYSDAYFSFAFHENFKYVSSELGDFTEKIKYDGWGASGLAYSLVLSSSSDALSVTIAGETVQLGSEYIDSLLSEEGLDIFVTFDNTTKEFCIYAIADNKVNLLIDFVCWDTKVAGFYKSTISSHDSNVIVNSVIYKITDEFDAESDLKNL